MIAERSPRGNDSVISMIFAARCRFLNNALTSSANRNLQKFVTSNSVPLFCAGPQENFTFHRDTCLKTAFSFPHVLVGCAGVRSGLLSITT